MNRIRKVWFVARALRAFGCWAVLAGLFGAGLPLAAAPPSPLTPAEAQAWREDLRELATQLPLRHKDFFHKRSRAEFEAAVRALDVRIPSLARHEVVVE